jgi:hypothetical protein
MTHDALTSARGLGSRAFWSLNCPAGQIPFDLVAVHLFLFRSGAGFVTLDVAPRGRRPEDRASATTWLDFLHYMRFAAGRRDVGITISRRSGQHPVTGERIEEPYFPPAAGGVRPDRPGDLRPLMEIIEAVLRTAGQQTDDGRWWQDVFVPGQLIPFAGLWFDGVATAEQPRWLYRLLNYFPSDRSIVPTSADLEPHRKRLYLEYAEAQWFVFSLEGGTFVAFDAPSGEFFRQQLAHHIRNRYFLPFVLASYQRFTLLDLAQQVSDAWTTRDGPARVAAFRRILDTLLELLARAYLTQVMQHDRHHQYYLRWQEVLQVQRLHREVHDAVEQIYRELALRASEAAAQAARAADEARRQEAEAAARARAESEEERRREDRREAEADRRLQEIITLFAIPSLLFGFLGINLAQVTSGEGMDPWLAFATIALFSVVAGSLAVFAIRRYSRRSMNGDKDRPR